MSNAEDSISVDDPAKNPVEYTRRPHMLRELDSDPDGSVWQSTGTHMVSAMMMVEQMRVRTMKEFFKIEASKATPQYGFRKRLTLFGDKGYQATKNELKVNLLGRGYINILSWKNLTWVIRKQAL